MSLTITKTRSPSPWPSIANPLISSTNAMRSGSPPREREALKLPVDDQVHADGQDRDRSRRNQWDDQAEADCVGVVAHHAAPVGGGRLDAQAQERKGAE